MALQDYGALMQSAGSVIPDINQQILQRAQASLMGAQAQEAQQQLAMQKLAYQRQLTFGNDMASFINNPSAKGLAELFGKYPEYAKQAQDAWGAMDADRRLQDTTQLGEAASLAVKGDYNGAAKVVQTRIDAEKAAGRDTSHYQPVLDLLSSPDPTKQKQAVGVLSYLVGTAVGPDKAAEFLKANGLSNEPIAVGMDQRLVTPQGQTIVDGQPKLQPVTDPVTGVSTPFNPYTGKFGADAVTGGQTAGGTGPTASGAPPSSGQGAGTPRSIRNNNPGNLRATPFTKKQPGYQSTDSAGYAVFESPQSGLAAQTALLSGKGYFAGGRNTVASIIEKWAPRKSNGGDNTDAQVNNYIRYVAGQIGVKPNQPLTQDALPRVAQAMSQFEAGATGHAGSVRVPPAAAPNAQDGAPAPAQAPVAHDPYTFGGGGLDTKDAPQNMMWTHGPNGQRTGVAPIPGSELDPASNDPQEVDDLARNWLATGQWAGSGGGMGGGGNIPTPLKKAAMARASELMKEIGITAADLPKIRSESTALKSSLTNVTSLLSNLQASENALHLNAQQVWNMHRQLVQDGILGGNPYLNSARLKYYANFGSADEKAHVKTYLDAINAYSTEYSKFMTSANGMGGSASPSDAARSQAGELNDPSLPATAMLNHLRQGEVEAANKRNGVAQQKEKLEQQLAGLLQPHSAPQAPTPAHVGHHYQVNIPAGAIQMLKSNPTPQIRQFFDQKYGPGKARQILGS